MIRLRTLLEAVEFTPRGNLWIDDVDSIPPDKWEKINRIMNNKGYAMRGGEDCKDSISKFLSNPNNKEPNTISADIFGPWVDTIAMVMGVKPPKAPEATKYDCKRVIRAAYRAFGTTSNIHEAGYILPSGKLLSLTSNAGHRDRDHREINSVYSSLGIKIPPDKNQSNSNIMMAFMKDCRAIRIGGSQPMADMWHEPTRQQANRLVDLINAHGGEMALICRSIKFGNKEHFYNRGTKPLVILRDIVHFYKTGEFLTPEA